MAKRKSKGRPRKSRKPGRPRKGGARKKSRKSGVRKSKRKSKDIEKMKSMNRITSMEPDVEKVARLVEYKGNISVPLIEFNHTIVKALVKPYKKAPIKKLVEKLFEGTSDQFLELAMIQVDRKNFDKLTYDYGRMEKIMKTKSKNVRIACAIAEFLTADILTSNLNVRTDPILLRIEKNANNISSRN